MSLVFGHDVVIVAHSHLRWDFVWQRPQQLLSRFAKTARVIFVEEPLYHSGPGGARLETSNPYPRVTRVVPMLPEAFRERADDGLRFVRSRLGPMVRQASDVIHWFYTPMSAAIMLGALNERIVVYDCMDELSAFRYAPADLAHREQILLACADVVFAGGRRLQESKSQWNDNVHFFGCGVDTKHFARARALETAVPRDVASLARPILGYIGVIDERLDYALLRRLAQAFPQASLVMVGPRVKVAPHELPHAPNVHWLGMRPYEALPAYLKAFDVCLMPFALNEATAYINPTKTLEYMAAGKPIVSTPVPDVLRNFAPIVRIGESSHAFVDQCRAALTGDESLRVRAGIDRAEHASWDGIVASMWRLLAAAADRANAEPVEAAPVVA